MLRWSQWMLLGVSLAWLGVGVAAAAPVSVELNKLEADGDSCKAYMVTNNSQDQALESLQLDLVMFDGDGIISKHLAVELGPLPADKTRVEVFRIEGTACSEINRILLNGVTHCGGAPDCAGEVLVSSRSDVAFVE
ncbi:hypothetical protein [Spiribacter vilamensis]|uniref:Tat pathway signal sequence domain protein n=1 Tax=Spiribacter vilamensis TaxID=531306 RepID=A0A4Q8D0B1_9GAMM|nr:hypothetical protein [Spiribacter vilamensis]RZU98704.1 hypothetical protein EV698_0963 [Spiribacter vilamensis]TVO62270.1 hypothetical protein FPL09_09380 [Spiribacter vilamensis]